MTKEKFQVNNDTLDKVKNSIKRKYLMSRRGLITSDLAYEKGCAFIEMAKELSNEATCLCLQGVDIRLYELFGGNGEQQTVAKIYFNI